MLIVRLQFGWVDMSNVHPGILMFSIAAAIFFAMKTLTLAYFSRVEERRFNSREWLCWLLTWPGMNPRDFFPISGSPVERPKRKAWAFAAAETIFGALLLVGLAPVALRYDELLAGWVALCGIAFLFHFGLLQIAALYWQKRGRPVEPIMCAPVLAKSVDEFWSRRWNLAFRDFARVFVFRPLARRFGPKTALIGGFVFSGLIHDLAISIPVRRGLGLPTLYFLLQSLGLFVERSTWGRSIGLGRGWRGWMFAAATTVPAAYLLFHPAFVRQVIVPLIPSS